MDVDSQKKLQLEVGEQLKTITGMPVDASTREMLAEFVVCMVVARKDSKVIEEELKAFLNEEEARELVEWLRSRVTQQERPEGITPAAADVAPVAGAVVKSGEGKRKKEKGKDADEDKRSRRRKADK